MSGTKPDGADARARAPDTIEGLFGSLESALLVYAQRLVGSEQTAQDIVQEAFLKLHNCFDSVRQPRPWLYRTVHNLAMNHLRSECKIVPLDLDEIGAKDMPDTRSLPDEHIERMEAIGQTRLCLAGLDDRSRELIQLKFEEGLSYKEMGERTGLSVSNVGYVLHHALKSMAVELRKIGVIP